MCKFKSHTPLMLQLNYYFLHIFVNLNFFTSPSGPHPYPFIVTSNIVTPRDLKDWGTRDLKDWGIIEVCYHISDSKLHALCTDKQKKKKLYTLAQHHWLESSIQMNVGPTICYWKFILLKWPPIFAPIVESCVQTVNVFKH